ncbi:MAG: hypothetical protein Q4F72_12575 [Desulfovibrionaceae bacterium]|nr:hypothetical protein [Desulfovibrionaceae bacterium]
MKQPFPMTLGHEAAPVPRSWRSLPERKILLQGLAELTARFGLRLQLTWKPVESVPLSPKDRKASARKAGARSARPGSDGTERVLCPWQTATLAWTGVPDSLAWDWASLAEALTLPGVRDGLFLAEARWEKGAWTIRGEVHARR